MPKILIISSSLQAGGAEKSAIKLANSLNATSGHEIYFGTYFKSELDFYDSPACSFLDFSISTNLTSTKNITFAMLPKIIANIRKARKIIVSQNIDLVISFGAGVGCLTYLMLFRTNISQITSERTSPDSEIYRPSFLARLLRPWIYQHGVLCSVQSREAQELVARIWNIESFVTPNHFEIPEQKYELQKSTGPCIAVGRVDHQKGYDLLIAAWIFIEKKYKNKLYIVTDDSAGRLNEMILLAGLKNVEIKPLSKDLNSIYNECTLYISVSRLEGFPNATAEAIIFGIPVLTSVNSDPVASWKKQQLCLTFDSLEPEVIAKKIASVLDDETLRKNISDIALQNRQDFTWDHVQSSWMDLIEKAIFLRNNLNTKE
jgi:amylovoran biosynthesis glycosyltransferase AmsD